MTQFVKVETAEGISRITLTRAENRNALNLDMCLELRAAIEAADADADVRVVLITAEGPVFCAGADLKERQGKDEVWVRMRRLAAFGCYQTIVACPKPVIAVAQGPVVGSGGEIAMSADYIIGSPKTTFRFPEPQWGTVGATQRLQRVIGKGRAKELLYTGRIMPAEEAHGLGLLARIFPEDQLMAEAQAMAEAIAKASPLAMQLTKQAVDLGSETGLDQGIKVELAAIDRLLAEGSWKQGIEDFAKRKDKVTP